MKVLRTILICLVIILFILIAILATGHTMFKRQVQKEIVQLFAESEDISGKIFTYDQIQALPEPVQRYFRYALRDGQNYISYARLKHTGTFRTSPDQKWMPISGREYFTTHKPGFVWFAKVKPFPLLWITARDTYYQGKGNVLIKLYSTITLGNAKGKHVHSNQLSPCILCVLRASAVKFLLEHKSDGEDPVGWVMSSLNQFPGSWRSALLEDFVYHNNLTQHSFFHRFCALSMNMNRIIKLLLSSDS